MKITLCGSTRFALMFSDWNTRLSKAGHVVFSIAAPALELTEAEKKTLDLVHLAKIDASDAIFVLDGIVDGKPYTGTSTRREIMWARMKGKGVFFFSNGGGARLLQDLRAAPLTSAALQPDAGLASVAPEDRKARADVLVEALAGRAVRDMQQDAAAERMLGAIVAGEVRIGGHCPTLDGPEMPAPAPISGPSQIELAAAGDVRGGE